MAGTDGHGAAPDHRQRLARLLVCTPATGLVDDEDQTLVTDLYALARQQGVVPLTLRALSPDRVPADLRDAGRASVVYTMKLELLCRDLCLRLHAAGLRVLILKGAALAWWLYPQPHLRATRRSGPVVRFACISPSGGQHPRSLRAYRRLWAGPGQLRDDAKSTSRHHSADRAGYPLAPVECTGVRRAFALR